MGTGRNARFNVNNVRHKPIWGVWLLLNISFWKIVHVWYDLKVSKVNDEFWFLSELSLSTERECVYDSSCVNACFSCCLLCLSVTVTPGYFCCRGTSFSLLSHLLTPFLFDYICLSIPFWASKPFCPASDPSHYCCVLVCVACARV